MTTRIKARANAFQGVQAAGAKIAIKREEGKIETYLPLFLNDATTDQKVFQSYERYEEFKKLQQEVDPDGFMKRAGGQKY